MSSKVAKLVLTAIALGGLVVWIAWRSTSLSNSSVATEDDRARGPTASSSDSINAIPPAVQPSQVAPSAASGAPDNHESNLAPREAKDGASIPTTEPASATNLGKAIVRGRVVGPDDKPQRALITVQYDDDKLGSGTQMLETAPDCTFKFEVEAASRCVVTARPRDPWAGLNDSLPLDVLPGGNEITVRLRRAMLIFGSVVDAATGEPHAASIDVKSSTGDGWGSAKLGQLQAFVRRPGIYAVSARSREGGWAIESNIVVPEGGDAGPIRIELRKTAHIRIVYKTVDTTLHCVVTADSYPLGEMDFSPQRGYELDVPSRAITVVLNDVRDTWKQTRSVTPAPGEKLDVEFN